MLNRITRGAIGALVLATTVTTSVLATDETGPEHVPFPFTPASEWGATPELIDPGFVVVAEDKSNDTAFVVIGDDQTNDAGFLVPPRSTVAPAVPGPSATPSATPVEPLRRLGTS